MTEPRKFRCAVLSAVKHDYVARGMATHPRFELAVVADDPGVPNWAHERNQQFADAFKIPYVRDVDRALRDFDVQVAIVSPEAERHVDLSIRAAQAGKHVVQDKAAGDTAQRRGSAGRGGGAEPRQVPDVEPQFPAGSAARARANRRGRNRPKSGRSTWTSTSPRDAGPPKGSRQPGYPPTDWLAHQIAAHVDGSDGGLGREPLGELAIEGIYPLGYVRMLTGLEVRRVFGRCAAFFHQLNGRQRR